MNACYFFTFQSIENCINICSKRHKKLAIKLIQKHAYASSDTNKGTSIIN